jgi:hypothetical protein
MPVTPEGQQRRIDATMGMLVGSIYLRGLHGSLTTA